ncbi:MAG: hypothetical protein QM564_11500 [Bergeyella sp.]
MHNITLIGTRHEEAGFCTSDKLYKIFDVINPDVIFEEMPPSYFDKYYVTNTRENLESSAIKKYLEHHNIKHIPVDSEDIPPESFFTEVENLHKQIENLNDINGFNYRKFVDENSLNIKLFGFQYINSDVAIKYCEIIDNSIKNGLQTINDEKLFRAYQNWQDVIIEMRENKMIQNIYNYSKENDFDRAVFTIGFSHRKSLMQKISEYQKNSDVKLNWIFYHNIAQFYNDEIIAFNENNLSC